MNKQTFDLLKLITLHAKKRILLDEISNKWNVSSRTFYNYWNEINDYLSSINAQHCFDFDGKRFIFTGTNTDRNYILSSISSLSLYEYKLSASERRAIIIALLASNTQPITNNIFEDIFFVSKNTIINDMKAIQFDLKEIGIEINEYKHTGTCLKANEYERRRLLFYILNKIDAVKKYFLEAPCDPCIRSLISFLKIDRYSLTVEKIMREAEELMLINVSDEDFYQMLLIFSICIVRIKNGHHLHKVVPQPSVDDAFIVFAQYVYNHFEADSTYVIDDNEINFFVETVHSFHIISRVIKPHSNPDYVSILLKELLRKLQSHYQTDLLNDKILDEYLTAHILACYHRIKQHQELSNPYLSEIRENYPKDLKTLKKYIYILENGLNVSLNDSELAYILMHILAAVERIYTQKHLPSILIVCSNGIATGNYIASQISKNFNANIVGNVSVHQVNPIVEKQNVDLIVSTVPYDNQKVPTIITNAFLTKDDISAIQSILSQNKHNISKENIDFKDINNKTFSFMNLINKDLIDLNKNAADWKEAIISAGELLLWNKSISVNYLQQMINLVVQYGPYIVVAPGVALAHAAPSDGVLNPGVSLIRLNKPVHFGKEGFDPISIIIACAVNDTLDYSNALLQLMAIIRKPDFFQCVSIAKTNQDVIKYLKNNKH